MTKYLNENEAIEGKKIICSFEKRPSEGKENERLTVTITGNPASATINKKWEYKV